jgi:AcrR family transcriptional regulator
VADIAKVLKMSPANVYRFFDSKTAIHQGVACRLMSEVEAAVTIIAAEPLSPKDRLREILATIHHMNAERYVGDARLHEMVELAMEESWEICDAHISRLGAAVGQVIGEGVVAGQFNPCDVEVTAKCLCTAMCRFFHPQMIASPCAKGIDPTLEQMIEFVIGAISTTK